MLGMVQDTIQLVPLCLYLLYVFLNFLIKEKHPQELSYSKYLSLEILLTFISFSFYGLRSTSQPFPVDRNGLTPTHQ